MIMTYEEKLQLPEWKIKRDSIIQRDNNRCIKCGYGEFEDIKFNFTIPKNLKYPFKNFEILKHYPLFTLTLTDFIIKWGIQIHSVIEDEVQYNFTVPDDDLVNRVMENLIDFYPKAGNWEDWNTSLRIFLENKNFKFSEINDLGVAYYIANWSDFVIIFNLKEHTDVINIQEKKQLHVHHKLYIQDKMPWEYDDKDLITLCNYCHQKTHENETILYYNRFGNLMGNMEKCDRCGGSGTLPEYKHVLGGRCFKCWGEGIDPTNSKFTI
jgi:hypothetical protein